MSPPTSAQCLAHAGGKTQIFAGLVFVERFQCLCTFAQLAAWCRRLAPMAQNIFEDLSRKPVARTLRPAAAMTYLKLAFAVTHRSPIRSWDTASFRGPRHTALPRAPDVGARKEHLRCQGGDLLPLRRAHNQQATNYCTRIASAFNITGQSIRRNRLMAHSIKRKGSERA